MTSYPAWKKPRYLGNHASQIKVTIEHCQEVMVALSEFVMKNSVKRPLAEKSRWRHIRLAIKPLNLGNHVSQNKSYLESLSGSHALSFRIRNEKSPEAPLTEKSRWRHIRLGIKPRYLGNHATEMKSYFGTLSGSHGRFFRMRHVNSPEAPTIREEITVTSYPACKKTSFSREPCVPDKTWYAMLSGKQSRGRSFKDTPINFNSGIMSIITIHELWWAAMCTRGALWLQALHGQIILDYLFPRILKSWTN